MKKYIKEFVNNKKENKYGVVKSTLVLVEAILAILFCTISVLLCRSITWMFDTWAHLTMYELVYQLTSPIEGTSEDMIVEYLIWCLPITLVVFLGLIVGVVITSDKKKVFQGMILLAAGTALLLDIHFVRMTWNRLEIGDYLANQKSTSDFIGLHYVDARNVEMIFPEEKRNLVYIFLESMETTYADKESGGAFEENVIPELTQLAMDNEDFSGQSELLNGGHTLPGSTWTIAAMFGQTSGLPLNISIEDNSMDTQDSFFSGIVTMGDILKDAGYNQKLVIGSDAVFGGRKLYFSEHGNYEIFDYNTAIEEGKIPEDYYVWWGYEDQKLFEYAKEEVLEMAGQNEPFNFTLLTVDTHFEDGYRCEICPDEYEVGYSDVMSCSSRQTAAFIRWIQQQDFYQNTTIVLVGDHLTMDRDYCAEIDPEYDQKTYVSYINSAAQVTVDEERLYTTLDLYPTTLASLGVSIEGDRLGLGTNLFSEQPTLAERYGLQTLENEVVKNSNFMEEIANLDNSKEEYRSREALRAEYDYKTNSIKVTMDAILCQDGYTSYVVAAWNKVDQSDLQWIPMETDESGEYCIDIDRQTFDNRDGLYIFHLYAINELGETVMLNDTSIKF